ncbi:glycosyltransferase family 4 protein [Embleya scabrispora]|uniref:glycosyltransferase family 4 protein n=1 Tax=Embleya scabrispora TaxID=159449 RepID=UPI0003717C89|nr:glycosyltransferase family 4 protein [Embleya scabrispora]
MKPRDSVPGPKARRDIFIVCNNIEELGGLQRWAHHTAGLLAGQGHDVHLVGIVHPNEPHDFKPGHSYRTSVLYDVHPPSAWSPKRLRDHANVPARVRETRRREEAHEVADRLTEMFRAARPGAIVIVPQVWAMEWVALADTTGLRVIGMSHESFEASKASSRFARVQRYFSDVDRLLLLTREDAEAWARAGMNNTGALPNPLPIDPTTSSDRRHKVVVSLGRFSYEKGYDLLLEAWGEIAPKHPDWKLRLYGGGSEDAALRAQALRLGVAGSVEFPGPTADVEGALREGAIFALSSRAEGFPMSLLEAMSMGIPCVAFDCAPGVREIISHENNGLLVARGNTESFAGAVRTLMADAELRDRLGEQALKDVQRYAPSSILQRWEQLFEFVYR